MVQHVIERDMGRVGKTQYNHAERVANEQDIDAGVIEQPCGRVVVGGERCDRETAFAGTQGCGFLVGSHGGGKTKSPRLGRRLDAMATRKGVEPFLPE